MMTLEKARAKEILVTELGYTRTEADSYLRDYPPIHDELALGVDRWLEDRTILDTSVMGIAITEIMQLQHAHFLMAVQELNRLLDNDLTPAQRDRLVEILRKPAIRW